MKTHSIAIFLAAIVASIVQAVPSIRDDSAINGLKKYSAGDFRRAGYPDWVRRRYEEIASHEATHVEFLTKALTDSGVTPIQKCQYSFPHHDPTSFVDLSVILEDVGSSAYTGASGRIQAKDYVTAAASILATEASHSSWISSAAQMANPWPTSAFVTPLTFSQVLTLASPFGTSCPNSLSIKTYPILHVTKNARPGGKAKLLFGVRPSHGEKFYAAIIEGFETTFVDMDQTTNEITFPKHICGPVYVVVTNNEKATDDASTVAGPAIMRFPCDSRRQSL